MTTIRDAYLYRGGLGSGRDLDTVVSSGWYYQAGSIDASSDLHYPIELPGLLEVFQHANFCHQRYTTAKSNRIFRRSRFSELEPWSVWVETLTSENAAGMMVYLGRLEKTVAELSAQVAKLSNPPK